MKLAQLHRAHVSGEEGLPQLQCRNGVLLQGQKMDSLYIHSIHVHSHFISYDQVLTLYRQ